MSALHDLAARALRVLDAEDAHRLTIGLLRAGLGPRVREGPAPAALAVELCGLSLSACIGLAAGFDKNAKVPGPMLAAGFLIVNEPILRDPAGRTLASAHLADVSGIDLFDVSRSAFDKAHTQQETADAMANAARQQYEAAANAARPPPVRSFRRVCVR